VYVLSDAWSDLRLKEARIDRLLTSEHLSVLKRYRNAVFHYQKDIHDSRVTDFTKSGPVQWVMELGDAYQEFFDRHNEEIDVEAIRDWLFAPPSV
jgi:phage/plasmid-associated DNA primase